MILITSGCHTVANDPNRTDWPVRVPRARLSRPASSAECLCRLYLALFDSALVLGLSVVRSPPRPGCVLSVTVTVTVS